MNTIPDPAAPLAPGLRLKGRVKWFNPDKGFGFVTPDDGSSDAFLHATALQAVGLASLPEGAELVCEITRGPRGQQVLQILEIDAETLVERRPTDDTPKLCGAVKWFAPEKGFGFIAADDGGKDVFVHMNMLKRFNIAVLHEGQRVAVVVSPTTKGREATWITVGN